MEKEQLWPGWDTIGVLGRGSFGCVYEIQRDIFGEKERSALKVISIPSNPSEIEELQSSDYSDQEITEHFRSCLEGIVKEYTIMSKMKGHRNIVLCEDLYYVQHDDGFGWDIFIKMELLTPLVKTLKEGYDEEKVLRLGMDICNALAFCGSKSILHRDIKPQNIFVGDDGSYKLGDFGIAKITEATVTGTYAGSPNYMAPEVLQGNSYGITADIYSLGLVLYWMMNHKRLPFVSERPGPDAISSAKDRRRSGETIPEPMEGSKALRRIVLKACAYCPENRYQTPEEMLRDLEAICLDSQTAKQPVAAEPAPKQETPAVRKHPPVYTPPAAPVEKNKPEIFDQVPKIIAILIVVLVLFVGIACVSVSWDEISGNFRQTEPQPELCYAISPFVFVEDSEYLVWGHRTHRRRNVEGIIFRNTRDYPAEAWDISADGDRSVMAWLEDGILTVGADRKIQLNPDSADLFHGYENIAYIQFNDCVDTSRVENMAYLFADCKSLQSLDLTGFDTGQVTSMQGMFFGCSALTDLELGKLDTSAVTNMRAMFYGCGVLRKLDVSSFDTSSVTTMRSMFSGCGTLTELDVRNFDTSRVDSFRAMFYECSGLTQLDLRSFDTSGATDLRSMFSGCRALEALDLRKFDADRVTDMEYLFADCGNLTRPRTSDRRILQAYEEK